MSHFTVMVVTDTPEELEAALQPFHEFECTGVLDQYVQDVDITQEARDDFEKAAATRYKDKSGQLFDPYEAMFYREPTEEEKPKVGMGSGFGGGLSWHSRDWNDGKGYRAKVHYLPEGWEEVELPRKDVESFAEFIQGYHGLHPLKKGDTAGDDHKHGYILIDESGEVIKAVDRTNPNKQWDWWTIGGRWSGLLRVKKGAEAERGEPGLMGSRFSAEGVDQCRVGDLDMDTMLAVQRKHIEDGRRKQFSEIIERMGKYPEQYTEDSFMLEDGAFEKWDQLSVKVKEAEQYLRTAWEAQESKGAFSAFIDAELERGCTHAFTLRQGNRLGYGHWDITPGKTLQQALDSASPVCTFGVLKDGQWYERGSMGWWGMVADEKDTDLWEAEFAKLLAGLPPEKIITIVDCHI